MGSPAGCDNMFDTSPSEESEESVDSFETSVPCTYSLPIAICHADPLCIGLDKLICSGLLCHTALEKRVSGYTTKSGVIKPWLASLIHLVNDGATPLIHTPELDVFGLSLQNDGTALKPSLQFDPAKHVIVGLERQ